MFYKIKRFLCPSGISVRLKEVKQYSRRFIKGKGKTFEFSGVKLAYIINFKYITRLFSKNL